MCLRLCEGNQLLCWAPLRPPCIGAWCCWLVSHMSCCRLAQGLSFSYYQHPLFSVLDPRIMYEGLKRDCASDPMLLTDLNNAWHQLKMFYNKNYVNRTCRTPIQSSQSSSSFSSASGSLPHSPKKVNLTSHYQKEDWVVINELDEFYKLPQEDFDLCKPLEWWLGRRSQFPNLYRLACDLFSIPGMFINVLMLIFNCLPCTTGSAVAVEHIFSGGCDNISLWHASLIPDTVRPLITHTPWWMAQAMGYYRLWVLKGMLKIESKKNHEKIMKYWDYRFLLEYLAYMRVFTIAERNQLNEYPSYSMSCQGEAAYSASPKGPPVCTYLGHPSLRYMRQ